MSNHKSIEKLLNFMTKGARFGYHSSQGTQAVSNHGGVDPCWVVMTLQLPPKCYWAGILT
ncbi:hypothetical protein ARTHRO_30196 [Limnospira indica PCC 8005]|uniref:Uncharacterized protein n=1 Tax=Limnospira indica PCC 8005 TaxID=376219 RepID=A0A9P1NZA5_9CYAN|nr:hypothetical protein ARTHRO_30196 [Limnospira indica PCC 8005]